MKRKFNINCHCEECHDEAILLGLLHCVRNDEGQKGLAMTLVMLMSLSFSLPSFAYDRCVGGSIIKRNEYGEEGAPSTCTQAMCPVRKENEDPKTFCVSDKQMNWWSAFTWCKSNGGTLASFASMCPGVNTYSNNTTGACPGLQGTFDSSHMAWSSLGGGTGNAFDVNLFSGNVITHNRHGGYASALCE